MSPFRTPNVPPTPPPVDTDELEALIRKKRRRMRILFFVCTFGLTTVGLGACMGPVAKELWDERKTGLDRAENKRFHAALDPLTARANASQAAFAAAWPKLRRGELGPRPDLGECQTYFAQPHIERSEDDTSLDRSSQGSGWTFIDGTSGGDAGIGSVGMGYHVLDLGNGQTFRLPSHALETKPPDQVPTLESSTDLLGRVERFQSRADDGIHHDWHDKFLDEVEEQTKDPPPADVIVFVDLWKDPAWAPVEERDDDGGAMERARERLERAKTHRPLAREFDSGFAVARAFVWDSGTARVTCAGRALAMSSDGITYRSDDLEPLRKDLALQLERAIGRSFQAAGDVDPAAKNDDALKEILERRSSR
jgi:hypothetical protein